MDVLESRKLLSTNLTAGHSVVTGIRDPGVQKNYSIALTAGQAIAVAAGDDNAGFQTELILIAPTGKAIARSVGDGGGFIGKIAPVSGTYRVRVRDLTGTHTAGVTLTAFFTIGTMPITDSDDAYTIASGRRFAATIGPGDLDVWAIPATKGQFLSVVANENANNDPVGVAALLVGPDGQGIASKSSDQGFIIDQTAAQTGTYYAVVYEPKPAGGATGRYGFSADTTPGPQYPGDPDTATPLQSGVARNGALPSGDTDVFNVSMTRGQSTTITASRTGGTTMAQVLLIDPDGNIVSTATTATNAKSTTLTYVARINGTYSIVVRNGVPDTGGNYRLTWTLA